MYVILIYNQSVLNLSPVSIESESFIQKKPINHNLVNKSSVGHVIYPQGLMRTHMLSNVEN